MRKPITDLNKFRDQFVRETLRRASFRWPPRNEAIKAARTKQGVNPLTGRLAWMHRCSGCNNEFFNKEIKLDHIKPVVRIHREMEQLPLPGMQQPLSPRTTGLDLGSFVLRMFPERSGFQVLCTACHKSKTASESSQRAAYRQVSRQGSPGVKRRSGKATLELVTMEGHAGSSESSELRGTQILPERMENCSKCQRKVYGSFIETPTCYQCRGED